MCIIGSSCHRPSSSSLTLEESNSRSAGSSNNNKKEQVNEQVHLRRNLIPTKKKKKRFPLCPWYEKLDGERARSDSHCSLPSTFFFLLPRQGDLIVSDPYHILFFGGSPKAIIQRNCFSDPFYHYSGYGSVPPRLVLFLPGVVKNATTE